MFVQSYNWPYVIFVCDNFLWITNDYRLDKIFVQLNRSHRRTRHEFIMNSFFFSLLLVNHINVVFFFFFFFSVWNQDMVHCQSERINTDDMHLSSSSSSSLFFLISSKPLEIILKFPSTQNRKTSIIGQDTAGCYNTIIFEHQMKHPFRRFVWWNTFLVFLSE